MKKIAFMGVMVAVVVASVTLSAGAAEITFTGGADGTGTDLAAAANWDGGALPGSDDVGVVDVAAHGTSYTVSEDVQLGGLVITNGTSMPTIQSTHVLTLGAGGLTLTGTGGIYLKSPMGIACDQTWTCGTGVADIQSLHWHGHAYDYEGKGRRPPQGAALRRQDRLLVDLGMEQQRMEPADADQFL